MTRRVATCAILVLAIPVVALKSSIAQQVVWCYVSDWTMDNPSNEFYQWHPYDPFEPDEGYFEWSGDISAGWSCTDGDQSKCALCYDLEIDEKDAATGDWSQIVPNDDLTFATYTDAVECNEGSYMRATFEYYFLRKNTDYRMIYKMKPYGANGCDSGNYNTKVKLMNTGEPD